MKLNPILKAPSRALLASAVAIAIGAVGVTAVSAATTQAHAVRAVPTVRPMSRAASVSPVPAPSATQTFSYFELSAPDGGTMHVVDNEPVSQANLGAGEMIVGEGDEPDAIRLFYDGPNDGNNSLESNSDFGCTHAIRPGRFEVNTATSACTIDIAWGEYDYKTATGTVDITHFVARPRYDHITMTFDLKNPEAAGGGHLLGSIGTFATHLTPAPGLTDPASLGRLTRYHRHHYTKVAWQPSTDLAVHRYLVRVEHGRHHVVGLNQGTSETHHFAHQYRVRTSRTETVSVYPEDDFGHVGSASTVIVDRGHH